MAKGRTRARNTIRLDEAADRPARRAVIDHILQTSGEAVGIISLPDGHTIDVNEAYCVLAQRTRAELIASRDTDLGIWIEPTTTEKVLALLTDTGSFDSFDTHLRRADGTVRDVSVSGDVVEIDEFVVGLVRFKDLTDTRRVESLQAELAAIVESCNDAIIGRDCAGIVTSWNVAAEALYGYRASEVIGTDISILLPPDRSGQDASLQLRVARGERIERFQTVRRHKNGHDIPVSLSVSPIKGPTGSMIGIATIARDVSVHPEVEEALERALEAEREATERLRLVDEVKNELLVAVSHDMRSALTVLLGFSSVLERGEGTLTPENRLEIVGRMRKAARKLDRILRDILDLDRLRRGIVEARRIPTDLPELIDRVLTDLEVPADHPIEREIDPIVAMLDPAKVERIIENLVANAVRHTPAGSTIWIRAREAGDGVRIAIEDNGGGVPAARKRAIFKAFERGQAYQPSPGTGIGLALVIRFAQLHGGRAWVEDRAGGGASFRVVLPTS